MRTIQDRGRVQIPKPVKEKLHLSDGDNVYWILGLDGKIYVEKARALG